MKPRIKLRSVPAVELPTVERSLAKQSQAEKLTEAIVYLRKRRKYILDRGVAKPSWGVPGKGKP